MHNERRQVKRYSIELDIDLILEDGTILSVKTLNLCQHGLQFKCDGQTVNEIEPRGIQSHPLDHLKTKSLLHDACHRKNICSLLNFSIMKKIAKKS